MNNLGFQRILALGLLTAILAACTATPQATPVNSSTPTAVTITSTMTSEIPSVTPTDLPTQTEAVTPTPEPAQTAAPEMVIPNLYPVNKCVSKYVGNFTIDFCVISVLVKSNRNMVFNVSWTPSGIPLGGLASKRSDEGNKNMFVTDNIGNRYDHIAGKGAAYHGAALTNNVTVYGSFEFNAPPEHAVYFTFHDDDNFLLINNIDLDVSAVVYATYPLVNPGYKIEYDKGAWQETAANSGQNELDNLKISNCKIQSIPNNEPQGTYKNTLAIRDITYKIYGYIDQTNQTAYRDYYAIYGLSGLSEASPAAFLVTIPLAQADACLGSVSTVLMDLKASGE